MGLEKCFVRMSHGIKLSSGSVAVRKTLLGANSLFALALHKVVRGSDSGVSRATLTLDQGLGPARPTSGTQISLLLSSSLKCPSCVRPSVVGFKRGYVCLCACQVVQFGIGADEEEDASSRSRVSVP